MDNATIRMIENVAVTMLILLFFGWMLFFVDGGKAGAVLLDLLALLWSIFYFPTILFHFFKYLLNYEWHVIFLTQQSAMKKILRSENIVYKIHLRGLACYSTSDYKYDLASIIAQNDKDCSNFTTDGQEIIDFHVKKLIKETIEDYK